MCGVAAELTVVLHDGLGLTLLLSVHSIVALEADKHNTKRRNPGPVGRSGQSAQCMHGRCPPNSVAARMDAARNPPIVVVAAV